MNEKSKTTSGGIGFTGLLTLLFIALKLLGVIDWSWVWVLAPIWISVVIVLLILAGGVIWAVISTSDHKRESKEKQDDSYREV